MTQDRPPRLALWIGIIATVIGLLIGVGFGALAVSRMLGLISDAANETTRGTPIPGERSFRGEGLATIVTRTPEPARFQCDVEDSAGNLVKMEQSSVGQSGTNPSGHDYVIQGAFQAEAGTDYTVRCKGDEVGATFEIALIPTSTVLALFAAFVGGAIFAFGLLMLIIAFVRRRQWRRARQELGPPAAAGPPGSWNPSATGPYPNGPGSAGRPPGDGAGDPPGRLTPPPPPPAPGPPGQDAAPQLPQRYPQRPPEPQ